MTFIVLILLGLVIYALGRLDRRSETAGEAEPVAQASAPAAGAPVAADTGVSPDVVAAIAVAMALAESESGAGPRATAPSTAGASWLQVGRARQLSATRPRRSSA